jgi:hypothetical protein
MSMTLHSTRAGLGYASRAQDSAFTRNDSLIMGALGGFLAPCGHGLVKIFEETKEAFAQPVAMLAPSNAGPSEAKDAVATPEGVTARQPVPPVVIRTAPRGLRFYSPLQWLAELFRRVGPVPTGDTRVPQDAEAASLQVEQAESTEHAESNAI